MSVFVPVAKVGELSEGTMKGVEVQRKELLLALVNNKYYAIDGRCPHMGGRLAQGKLEGTVVTCPLHGSQFNVTNGKVVRWLKGSGILSSVGRALKGPKPILTHQVKVEGDSILVEM